METLGINQVTVLPGDNSGREPPDPISNSEVKTSSADDSLGFPHAKVGHCQAFNKTKAHRKVGLFFIKKLVLKWFGMVIHATKMPGAFLNSNLLLAPKG